MSDISPINILIANEQAQEAKETALSLRAFFPDSRIEVVYSADEVLHRVAKSEWHTILADVSLFHQSGLTTLTEVKRQAPMATIIIQADCNDMTLGTQVLQYGVDFYIAKNTHAFLRELPFVLRTFFKNQDLNSRWNAANERVLRLEAQVSRMQTDQQSLVEHLDQVRLERTQLQEQLQAYQVELSQTKEKKQLLLDQWEKLRQAHATMEEEFQQVTGQLAHERGENQAYREQVEKLRQERDQLQERLFRIDGEKQTLLAQLEQTRHTYTLLEEGFKRQDAELSQERNENQTNREQLEKLRQERVQLQEQLVLLQMEKQTVLAQLEQMRLGHAQMEERIKRLEERLLQEQRG
jgi:DNA-binding NarL/FixJ family response regulator